VSYISLPMPLTSNARVDIHRGICRPPVRCPLVVRARVAIADDAAIVLSYQLRMRPSRLDYSSAHFVDTWNLGLE
jgi:hypothetical protein